MGGGVAGEGRGAQPRVGGNTSRERWVSIGASAGGRGTRVAGGEPGAKGRHGARSARLSPPGAAGPGEARETSSGRVFAAVFKTRSIGRRPGKEKLISWHVGDGADTQPHADGDRSTASVVRRLQRV